MKTGTIINKRRPARMLLIEDNKGDVILTTRAFSESPTPCEISAVSNGEEALAMLLRQGKYADRLLPDIIMLDLNLPQMNGLEVLKAIKENPEIRHIPTIILSSSLADKDVIACYGMHANAYVSKPSSFDEFIALAKSIDSFWFTLALMPGQQSLALTL